MECNDENHLFLLKNYDIFPTYITFFNALMENSCHQINTHILAVECND